VKAKAVAPHLLDLGTKISNTWLLTDPRGRRFLIDSGHPLERLPLTSALLRAGVRGPGDITAILLTHRHCDHAGNAAWIRKRFGARVYIHEFDAAALEGRVSSPPLCGGTSGDQAFYEKWLCQYEDKFPAHCEVDGVFGDQGGDATFNGFGFKVIPTPGHTEGSVMFHHEASATLFSGDAILSRRSVEMKVRGLIWLECLHGEKPK
jgi:glyoxylase-like metal-dependent hydrolase (beta-lactamase superfamily II)